MDSPLDRAKRKRRETGEHWTQDDELDWVKRHPEDRREGWLHPSEVQHDPRLIPDIEPLDPREPDELQPVLDGVDIIDAYNKWNVKGFHCDPGQKREGIKVRCPNPEHEDLDPSAWINRDKQVYTCGGCGFEGGDKYHIAAYRFGYPVPEYQRNGDFPKLRRDMAQDLGVYISKTPGGTEVVIIPDDDSTQVEQENESPSNVVAFPGLTEEDLQLDKELKEHNLFIDWEGIVVPETFLWNWMHSTTIDDLPHEFYFWLGMQALGCVGGPDVILHDYKPVKPNLFVCLYGRTGSGKSRAMDPYLNLLDEALPYDPDPTKGSSGIKMVSSVGSSEALIKSFTHEIQDPSTMKVTGLAPVRGLVRVEEFATFVAKSSRSGNPMKETLIELHDAYKRDVTHYSLSGGIMRAHNPFCQMITTTQPKAIHAFMRRTDADSGFMNRWVFATGLRRRERIAHGGVQIDIDESVKHLKALRTWCGTGHEMFLRDDALNAWEKFFHGNIGPMLDTTDESMFSRIDLTLKKIIVLLSINEKLPHPTPDVVERATSLYPYLRQTYRMFSHDIAHDEDEECQNRIVGLIEKYESKYQTGPTLREIVMRISGKFAKTSIERAIRTLELLDMIQVDKSQKARGPAAKRYKLNAG